MVPHTPVSVNVGEVVVDVADEFRNLLVKGGLAIASAFFTEEVTKLCGPRYARGDELANRWGHAKGDVVLGGRRAKLTRPRVRRNGEEVELESFAQLQREDPLDDRAVEQMLVGVSEGDAATLLPLPPPDDEEVSALLFTVATRTVRLLKKRGLLDDAAFPESTHDQTLAASLQQRWPFPADPLPKHKRRCAFLEGFSLHANTAVHQNDRLGLQTLCRYGARGALCLSRLTRREDGRLCYELKRPGPNGERELVLTPLELTRRLVALVPPPRVHLVHFGGVFAPRAKLRPHVVPCPPQTACDSDRLPAADSGPACDAAPEAQKPPALG